MGHRILAQPDALGHFLAFPAWTLSLPAGEEVRALHAVPRAPAASLGKVLGNRTTLYKYLNPRLAAVVSGSAHPRACAVRLIDGASGAVVYHAQVPAQEGLEPCDVKAALAENWLVYHYWDGRAEGPDGAKGYRMVSVELYEGQGVDEKTKRFVQFIVSFAVRPGADNDGS